MVNSSTMDNFYTITFDSDDGFPELYTKQVEYGQPVGDLGYIDEKGLYLNEPIKDGYTFQGWYRKDPNEHEVQLTSDTVYPFKWDSTYVAKWTPKVETCRIEWNAMGGTVRNRVSTHKYGSMFRTLQVANYRGYDFVGWFTQRNGGEQVTPLTAITESRTYYAHWTVKICKVRFDAKNGQTIKPIEVQYSRSIGELPQLSWIGREFLGWRTTRGVKVTKNTFVYEDMDLVADWKLIQYSITYDCWLQSMYIPAEMKKTYTIVDREYVPPDLDYPGYIFNGWTPEKLPANSTGNWKFTASWYLDTFSLSFDLNYETDEEPPEDIAITYKDPIGELPTVERRGYEFVGWAVEKDGQEFINSETEYDAPEDMTVYAIWKPIVYTIEYDLGGHGRLPLEFPVEYTIENQQNIYPPELSKEVGYIFAGWTPEAVYPGQIGDVTFRAEWNPYVYTVKYNSTGSQGATMDSIHQYNVPSTLSVNGYSRRYYITYISYPGYPQKTSEVDFEFLGWSTQENGRVKYNDRESVVNLLVQGDNLYNLYAIWNPKAEFLYTVSREGYDFEGWYATDRRGNEYWVGNAGDVFTPTEDITLTAHWRRTVYIVIFDPVGGVVRDATEMVEHNSTIPDLPQATKTGYELVGWFTEIIGGEQLTEETKITANKTYYAHWRLLEESEASEGQ